MSNFTERFYQLNIDAHNDDGAGWKVGNTGSEAGKYCFVYRIADGCMEYKTDENGARIMYSFEEAVVAAEEENAEAARRAKIRAHVRSNVITAEPWKVGHNSGYKRPYFVYNVNGGYALTKTGQHRRFASLESASAIADLMNLEDQQITREALANRRERQSRTFEQSELEDEIASIGGCSVKVWSDDGIGETKRLHIRDPRGTQILKGAIIAASNEERFETQVEALEAELDQIRVSNRRSYGSIAHVEALNAALESALALLGTTIEEGITK